MVLTLTFLVGLFQVGLGLARLGSLVNFVSHSVIVGFTSGAAIVIATSQMRHLTGIELQKGHYFVHIWAELIPKLSETNLYVLAVAVITLIIALLFKKFLPNWPGMLFAMIGGSLLALLLDGKNHGVHLVGALPQHLPPLSSPHLTIASLRELAPGSLAIAMLGLAEAVSIARSPQNRNNVLTAIRNLSGRAYLTS